MTRFHQSLAVSALLVSLATPYPTTADTAHRRPNPVLHWNTIASAAFAPTQGLDPLGQSRTFAILHAAIHDVVNAIDARYVPYTPGLPLTPGASLDAGVAAAARAVIIALVPDQAVLVEEAYAGALAAIDEGPGKVAGIAAGQAAATATLSRRHHDGLTGVAQPLYVPRPAPGDYQFTAPFDLANLPGWGRLQPFVIKTDQHRLDGPLPLSGPQYARDFAEVAAIGALASTTRTHDQSQIAQFWYEDSPLGWNRIANTVMTGNELDPWRAARTLALLNFAMADAYIAGFADKYTHRFWRPVTAIQQAATDGNPRTQADPAWKPFLLTPPVPDYPSTHTVVGTAAAEVLIDAFGDAVRFDATSLTLPGATRSFTGFSMAARENGMSRVYAGIHFPHAVKDGHRQGRGVGRVVTGALPPLR